MAGSARHASPYALLSASIATDFVTTAQNTWVSVPFATSLELEGNGFLERVSGSDTQFRALADMHATIHIRYDITNPGRDRREYQQRIRINGTTVPVGSFSGNISMKDKKMMASYFMSFDLLANDYIEFQVNPLNDNVTLYALGSYLELKLMELE